MLYENNDEQTSLFLSWINIMKTLVIHHPEDKVVDENKKSFVKCCATRIGEGFALSKEKVASLKPGDKVVILCSTQGNQRRAEGELVKLEHSGATRSGLKRYNVFIKNIKVVSYHRNDFGKLNHNGIVVF